MNVTFKTKSFLELTAELKNAISELEEQIVDESGTNNILSPNFSIEQIRANTKNEKIRQAINQLRIQLAEIGIRKGETIDHLDWFKDVPLKKIQRDIFLSVYQEKNTYQKIHELTGIEPKEVRQIYQRAFQIITNYLREKCKSKI